LSVDFSEHRVRKTRLSPEAALLKISNWCAYQERSQHETRIKLRDYGLEASLAEEIIANLIGENFLNEERFAMAFAGGKFRIKQWGRNKIKAELKWHKIPESLIQKALKSIDAGDYEKAIEKLIEKKQRSLKHGTRQKTVYSILSYAVSRGFESDLVTDKLNELLPR
jgi:regulatory protein